MQSASPAVTCTPSYLSAPCHKAGDVLPLLSGHFDTTSGHKREKQSYLNICEAIDVQPGKVRPKHSKVVQMVWVHTHPHRRLQVLFLTDIVEEAVAAKRAGLGQCACFRRKRILTVPGAFCSSRIISATFLISVPELFIPQPRVLWSGQGMLSSTRSSVRAFSRQPTLTKSRSGDTSCRRRPCCTRGCRNAQKRQRTNHSQVS